MKQAIRAAAILGAAAAAVIACGDKTPKVTHPVGTGSGSGSGSGSAVASHPGSAAAVPGEAPDIGCLTTSCVFYAGTGSYYTCLAGGEGTCFHIGAPCTPSDGCMFDPTANAYKQCSKPVEGRCAQWGGACAPASKCMLDPKDGLHRTCEQVTGGTCARYGALCSP